MMSAKAALRKIVKPLRTGPTGFISVFFSLALALTLAFMWFSAARIEVILEVLGTFAFRSLLYLFLFIVLRKIYARAYGGSLGGFWIVLACNVIQILLAIPFIVLNRNYVDIPFYLLWILAIAWCHRGSTAAAISLLAAINAAGLLISSIGLAAILLIPDDNQYKLFSLVTTQWLESFFCAYFLFLFLKNKTSELASDSRNTLHFSKPLLARRFILMYLLLMFAFGIVYRNVNALEHGRSFIWNEHVEDRAVTTALHKDHPEIPYEIFSGIVKFIRTDPDSMVISTASSYPCQDKYDSPSKGSIGLYWAQYYAQKLKNMGLRYCQFSLDSCQYNEGASIKRLRLECFHAQPKDASVSRGTDDKPYRPILIVDKWQRFEEGQVRTEVSPIQFPGPIPVDWIVWFLRYSHNFLDGDAASIVHKIHDYTNISLIEYLYFSCATIATIGYGDIVAVSTWARVLVMLESILGVVLIGLAVSLLVK